MKISDVANNSGLIEDIDFICGTNSTSYPTSDKVRNINRHYYKAVIDAIKYSGRVQWDDTNQATLPEYTTTLVAGQQDYSVPTNLLKIWAVEVKDADGNWSRLREIDIQDLGSTITDFAETDGMPRYYDVRGDSIFLYPSAAAASVTLVDGLKMYFSRDVDEFVAADTTQEPGISEPFHRLLSLGPAYDWLLVNDTQQKADRILQQYEQLRLEMRQFYSTKNKDVRTAFQPTHRTEDYT